VNNYVSSEDMKENPFFCDYYEKLEKKIPIVAFSVSSQNCPYYKMTDAEKSQMRSYMRHFAKITVRDEWTRQMVDEVAGIKDVAITPDPVFAFNQNCYIEVPSKEEICRKFSLPEHYALISFSPHLLNEDYVRKIGSSLQKKGITPVSLPEPEGLATFGFDHQVNLPLSPIDWYALIKHADGYIGTRMHPIIVCLHNSVPFFSFDGNGIKDSVSGQFNQKSSKIYDILLKAGLETNTYGLRSGLSLPDTQEIVDKVLSFDRQRCSLFAQQKAAEYEQAMRDIISI